MTARVHQWSLKEVKRNTQFQSCIDEYWFLLLLSRGWLFSLNKHYYKKVPLEIWPSEQFLCQSKSIILYDLFNVVVQFWLVFVCLFVCLFVFDVYIHVVIPEKAFFLTIIPKRSFKVVLYGAKSVWAAISQSDLRAGEIKPLSGAWKHVTGGNAGKHITGGSVGKKESK